jgi:hypothetical protein
MEIGPSIGGAAENVYREPRHSYLVGWLVASFRRWHLFGFTLNIVQVFQSPYIQLISFHVN